MRNARRDCGKPAVRAVSSVDRPDKRPDLRWQAVFVSLLILALSLIAACAINPATGRPQLALMSESQEIALGRQAHEEIGGALEVYDDAALQEYIAGLGHKLAALSERPELPWTFTVVDDPAVNAFALPGGFIYLTRGILTYMTSEAQVISVLAHEIGHVTARHSVDQYSKAQLASFGLLAGMILVPELRNVADLAQTGLQLLFLKFSRDDERQADELGLRYLTRAGYEPQEMVAMFRTLERSDQDERQGRLPEWLATHPHPHNRVTNTAAQIRQLPPALTATTVGRDAFLAHVDGMVFADDPRQGFFENNTFYHPTLAFQIEMPPGWKTANEPQAVTAVSPNQDAAVALTMVPASSPTDAARRFFSQSGVQAQSSSRESLHGLDAVSGTFVAQQEQGVVGGVVAFSEHHSRIFQVLGYTPARRFERYASDLTRSVTSFAPLRDPHRLNVKPKRIDLVKVTQAIPVEEFARRHPSTVDVPTLRLINQLEEGQNLEPGKRYKRVVGGT